MVSAGWQGTQCSSLSSRLVWVLVTPPPLLRSTSLDPSLTVALLTFLLHCLSLSLEFAYSLSANVLNSY